MNERVEAADVVLAPIPVAEFTALVSSYLALLAGEPSVIRELVLNGIVQAGLRVMRDEHSKAANRRFAAVMGWSESEEEGT